MNTESIDCRKVETIEQPGDFKFSEELDYLYIWTPGATGPDALRLSRTTTDRPATWWWDGDTEKPTLEPSIHAIGEWHGYLTAGRLVSC